MQGRMIYTIADLKPTADGQVYLEDNEPFDPRKEGRFAGELEPK